MSSFIPIGAEDDRFYIEVLPVEGQTGIKQRSRDGLTEKLTKDDFKQMIRQSVMPACQTFVDVWQELNQPLTAESAEVEFNLGFTATGSAVIVQASGQASFKVKVNWKFTPNSSPVLNRQLAANLSPISNLTESITAFSTGRSPVENLATVQDPVNELEKILRDQFGGNLPEDIANDLKLLQQTSGMGVGGTNPPPPPPPPDIIDIINRILRRVLRS